YFGIMRVNLKYIFGMPGDISGAPCLGADIVLAEDPPCREDEREEPVGALRRRYKFGDHEAALAAHEAIDMHDRRSVRGLVVAGPLDRAHPVELLEGDAGKSRCHLGDLVHDRGA